MGGSPFALLLAAIQPCPLARQKAWRNLTMALMPSRMQDKPLAVPPHQMDESQLAAARMEYLYDKHRIKAKRQRELQESPEFQLGG